MMKNFWIVIAHWAALIRKHRDTKRKSRILKRQAKELKAAIKKANELHKTTGRAYYVIPDYHGILQVVDKFNVKDLKKAKIMSKEVNVFNLLQEAEYSTINNHFLILFKAVAKNKVGFMTAYTFFRGTIDEAVFKYKDHKWDEIQILGGFERAVTIENGKVKYH